MESETALLDLPFEDIVIVIEAMDYPSIIKLCQSSRAFNELCRNPTIRDILTRKKAVDMVGHVIRATNFRPIRFRYSSAFSFSLPQAVDFGQAMRRIEALKRKNAPDDDIVLFSTGEMEGVWIQHSRGEWMIVNGIDARFTFQIDIDIDVVLFLFKAAQSLITNREFGRINVYSDGSVEKQLF